MKQMNGNGTTNDNNAEGEDVSERSSSSASSCCQWLSDCYLMGCLQWLTQRMIAIAGDDVNLWTLSYLSSNGGDVRNDDFERHYAYR
jgi:hypothetical protein